MPQPKNIFLSNSCRRDEKLFLSALIADQNPMCCYSFIVNSTKSPFFCPFFITLCTSFMYVLMLDIYHQFCILLLLLLLCSFRFYFDLLSIKRFATANALFFVLVPDYTSSTRCLPINVLEVLKNSVFFTSLVCNLFHFEFIKGKNREQHAD